MGESEGQEGLLVDIETGVVRKDHVLVQSAPGALLFLGFGPRAELLCRFAFEEADDPNPFIARCERIAKAVESGGLAKARGMGVPRRVLDIEDRTLRRLAIAEALAKAGYDPDEPRDDHGRWTSAAGSAVAAATATAISAVEDVAGGFGRRSASLFGEVAPEILEGLARIGAKFAEPTAFFGTLFIPTHDGSSNVQQGMLPGRPDVSYEYDRDTDTLRLAESQYDVPLYSGQPGNDGVFRDQDGKAFGRLVDGSIVLDADEAPIYASIGAAGAQSRAQAQARALADTNPKLCPDPSPDRKGARVKDWFYQAYIGELVNPGRPPLPLGIAIRLPKAGLDHDPDPSNVFDWVHFDDCRLADGTMIEVKGTGYLAMLQKGEQSYPWVGVRDQLIKQAQSQIDAARGRPIEWYVAEPEFAGYLHRLFFFRKFNGITVIEAPPPW